MDGLFPDLVVSRLERSTSSTTRTTSSPSTSTTTRTTSSTSTSTTTRTSSTSSSGTALSKELHSLHTLCVAGHATLGFNLYCTCKHPNRIRLSTNYTTCPTLRGTDSSTRYTDIDTTKHTIWNVVLVYTWCSDSHKLQFLCSTRIA